MKKPIKYANEPLGRLRVVKDFLPSPGELVLREDTEKVTIVLSKRGINFFKREADDSSVTGSLCGGACDRQKTKS